MFDHNIVRAVFPWLQTESSFKVLSVVYSQRFLHETFHRQLSSSCQPCFDKNILYRPSIPCIACVDDVGFIKACDKCIYNGAPLVHTMEVGTMLLWSANANNTDQESLRRRNRSCLIKTRDNMLENCWVSAER